MKENRIAFFISSHGFGHAARASAVMAALHNIVPSICFEIFTTVPRWFFGKSLTGPFNYHSILTDIGLEQKTPLQVDLCKTIDTLEHFIPFDPFSIRLLADMLVKTGCELIVCDISPMGIETGKETGIPSILVENFTWDWIYSGYMDQDIRMDKYAAYLRDIFNRADYHIQTEPICCPRPVDLKTSPVSRKVRVPAEGIRKRLGIEKGKKAILITMGGISQGYNFLKKLKVQGDTCFIVPGGSQSSDLEKEGNILLLPFHSDFFHPDLINASDGVIGKLGYSTVAEVYQSGIPFGYITRPDFKESPILAAYCEKEMKGIAFTEEGFQGGGWVDRIPDLLSFPRIIRRDVDGASQAAGFIYNLLS